MADIQPQENANDQGDQEHRPKTLLIAHVKAHLVSGEAFDLLPIKHEEDVKNEVNALVESWSRSGFLLRGRHMYPWHQVKMLEVVEIEEAPLREAHQRLEELYAADRARIQESFWRTKRKTPKKHGDGGAGEKDSEKNKDESKGQH